MVRTTFAPLVRTAVGLSLSALIAAGMLLAGGLGPSTTTAAYHDDAYMNLSMTVVDKRTAVITGRIEAQYGTIPTGTVTLVRGAETLATATLDAGAYRFELAVPMTWSGDVELEVVYGGDANHEASRSAVTVSLGT
ncbi:Ig-like domain-containing protein [Leifsonia sp. WHRI 6310E]|uniref:Ig-like domain-containing protein n=1 Tax=Leifsonia sp. WHRI 6310E TaxID=3162562 RepID=UPI0032F0469B